MQSAAQAIIGPRQLLSKKLRTWILRAVAQLLFWTVLALGLAVYLHEAGATIPWRELFLSAFAFYWSSAILTPIVIFGTRRLVRGKWWQQVALHLVGVTAFIVAHPAITCALIDWAPDMRPTYIEFVWAELMPNLIMYAAIAGLAFVASYNAEVQNRKIEEAKLRTELAQAHAHMLRTQIRPEFLFQTFHEISRLMATDPESARSVMARLSEMLRIALDSDGSEHASLRECLELFECYLDLEKARLGEMFHFDFRTDPDALDALLPRELLQSMVEGVLDKASAPLLQPAFVNLKADLSDDKLRMSVEVGGPGLTGSVQWTSDAADSGSRMQKSLSGPQVLRWLTLPNQTLRVEMEMPFAATGIV